MKLDRLEAWKAGMRKGKHAWKTGVVGREERLQAHKAEISKIMAHWEAGSLGRMEDWHAGTIRYTQPTC